MLELAAGVYLLIKAAGAMHAVGPVTADLKVCNSYIEALTDADGLKLRLVDGREVMLATGRARPLFCVEKLP